MNQQKVVISQHLEQSLSQALTECNHDRLFVLVDETTRQLCLPVLTSSIRHQTSDIFVITIGATDQYKTLDTLYYGKKMFDEGVYVNPVIAPACVEGECLLRTTLMATHTEPVIDEAVEIIARVLREGAPEM